jgi:hypothetical protein
MKLIDLKPDSRFFGMFIGDSSVGKTNAAVSFAALGKVKLYDLDLRSRGALSAREWLGDETFSKIDVEQFPPGKGFKEIDQSLEKLGLEVSLGASSYKTVIIDSLTTEARAMVADALSMDEPNKKGTPLIRGKILGSLRMPGPGHYGYEQEALLQILEFLKSLPINVIVSAHLIDRFGKPPGGNEYSENIVVGEKLAVRDKVGVNTLIHFDEVYKFTKSESANELKYFVKFRDGDLARTTLSNLPNDKIEITKRSFYETWKAYITGERTS